MVHAEGAPAQLSEHPLPAHHALEFFGVEDKAALIEQRRSLSAETPFPACVTVVSCCCSGASSGGTTSPACPRSASLSKAVLEWEAGRQRRAMVASNSRRSGVVSAYFHQELASLSKKAAKE
ncbi:hypothetical protein T484DRAFT_1746860 [Baffinella frigidus]|nr:hypothetical protein T484DRAFT_1746860 [Cryptophyta sp. CCMP2293]